MTKRTCLISACEKESYCKGYCRNHYNSLLRHNDPLHAERFLEQRKLKAEQNRIANSQKPKRQSNVGKMCKVKNCTNLAKIKGHCAKHDARIKRNGTLEVKKKRSNIQVDTCLVLGCTTKPQTHGICAQHLDNIKALKTPLKPRIVKLCGVKGCDKPHMAKGMCNTHYVQWKIIIRDYKLASYVTLSGYE